MFLDSDDRLNSQMIEKLLKKMTEENADLAVCGFSKFYKDGNLNSWEAIDTVLHGQKFYREFGKLYDMTLMSGPCFKMYRADIIKDNSIIFDTEKSLGEDLTFNISYYDYCNTVVCISTPMYEYRTVKHTSLSNKFNPQKSEIQYELYNMVVDFCRKHKCLEENIKAVNTVFFRQTYVQIQDVVNSDLNSADKKICVQRILDKYMSAEFLSNVNIKTRHNKIVVSLMQKRKISALFLLIKIKNILKRVK